jgi:hypothetical protein
MGAIQRPQSWRLDYEYRYSSRRNDPEPQLSTRNWRPNQQETGGRIMRVIIELEFENLPSRVDVENYLKELIDDGSLFYHLAQREA